MKSTLCGVIGCPHEFDPPIGARCISIFNHHFLHVFGSVNAFTLEPCAGVPHLYCPFLQPIAACLNLVQLFPHLIRQISHPSLASLCAPFLLARKFKLLRNMCDAVSTSAIFWALSIVPGNRYILLGLISVTLIIYAVNSQRPSHKLRLVEEAIKVAEEILERAQWNCSRNQVELMDETTHLLKAKISASEIRSRLLETDGVTTWKEFVKYLQSLRDITQKMKQCAKEVKEIQTSILRTIEAERRRKISEGVQESQEILDTLISSLMRASLV
ncbi:hypothetical protein MVEN_00968900 [Mycena venus]|uniref:Uncharacterized protein n=1 Tax=Mycena venus TaxID=2733690 RepID=A0A8H7CZV7_9AGAR|nr:hypothetical protein MVEN_00968900 [Mycena venus]